MNQVEIIKIIKDIVKVPTFTNGDVYSVWNTNEIKYSAVNVALESAEVDNDMVNYSFIIYYGDRLLPNESNFNFIQVDAFRVLTSLINELSDIDDLDVDNSYTITPFQQQFADYLAGAYVRLNVTSGHSLEYCYKEYEDIIQCPECTDSISLISTNIDIADNGTYILEPSEGEAYNKVIVNVDIDTNCPECEECPSQENLVIDITSNGSTSYLPVENTLFNEVIVNVNVPGGDLNFSGLGYDAETSAFCNNEITEAIAYSEDIYNNWDSDTEWAGARFCRNTNIKYVPNIDTSKVIDANMMFEDCTALIIAPTLDFSSATDIGCLYSRCTSLKKIEGLITSDVLQNAGGIFQGCTLLQEVPYFETGSATNLDYMFSECRSLTSIPSYDTSNNRSMAFMFFNCWGLTEIPYMNTSNVENMYYTFTQTNITTIPAIDTSNVIDFNCCFGWCNYLESLPLLDCTNAVDTYSIVIGCGSLKHLEGFANLHTSLGLSECPQLTHESLMNVINNLSTVTDYTELFLGYDNYSKLTEDEIAIVINKGWTVIY